jgi:hypothetical protein
MSTEEHRTASPDARNGSIGPDKTSALPDLPLPAVESDKAGLVRGGATAPGVQAQPSQTKITVSP